MQVSKATVLPLSKATTVSCGAKAAACAELAQLAEKQKNGVSFGTAAGVCLPFGCMEAAVQVSCIALQHGMITNRLTISCIETLVCSLLLLSWLIQ